MTWQCKILLWPPLLGLLAGCAASPPPAAAPRVLAQPTLTAADIKTAQLHAYWAGYAAGRHYQRKLDAQATPDAPSPTPSPAPPAVPVPPPPVAPSLAPVDGYNPSGPAQPVATPPD